MKITSLFSLQELQEQLDAKMVKATAHPSRPLWILNYTQMATFTPEKWNHVTDICRGVIYDPETLEVVSRPFRKFWNYADARHPETLPENLPTSPPTVTRKMDGSLGILYEIDGKWSVSTRGSFSSEQAVWATQWLINRYPFEWPDGYTPLVEIIYPDNQIVVKYPFEGLVLLAGVNIETGEEMSRLEMQNLAFTNDMRLVEQFDKQIPNLVEEDVQNEEGYVVAWERQGTTPLRVKIKHSTYCRLHKLLTQTNAVTVWEMLRDGEDITAKTIDAPSEFTQWIRGVESRLRASYEAIENAALEAMLNYNGEKFITTPEQRKQFAIYASAQKTVTPILFAMLDGKGYCPIIWKMIRPNGAEKAFRVDDE